MSDQSRTVTVPPASGHCAVFIDRDGVIVPDDGLATGNIVLLSGAAGALRLLHERGFELVVVTNQPNIARGLVSEEDVNARNAAIRCRVAEEAGPIPLLFYVCPHHPRADVAAYRMDCACRKPKPGMLERAAAENGLDLSRSFMVGDRITDIVAGASAGCTTVQVLCGRHADPPIESSVVIDPAIRADAVCEDLAAAAAWILQQ